MSLLSEEQLDLIMRDNNPLHSYIKFARAIEAAVLEAQPTDQRLINLLCRIHRDGGHYIAEHGLDKAVEDADMRVAEQNAALDAQAEQEPVAWCVAYDDPRMGRIHSNPTMCEPEVDVHVSKCGGVVVKAPLFAAPVVQSGSVDCIGLALDLEARAKTVESQTTERAMISAANGLRLIAAAEGKK